LLAAALALLAGACTHRTPPSTGDSTTAARAFTNRVWLRTSADPPLGSMLIFLSDGALVQDSCWETYRLSRWREDGPGTLRWQEDTAEIVATVVNATDAELTLRLDLVGGPSTATYAAATVPYVCPDLPR
jgi:hypothetical protein